MSHLDTPELLDRLRAEGPALAAAAERAGLDAAVPTCPDWRVRDLLGHIGGVHRWAAAHVAGPRPEPMPDEEVAPLFVAPGDDKLVAWYRDGHADLVATLAAADPATECWAFLPAPSGVAFWTRRQAHETAIHRADAESATGTVTGVPPRFAADGIDELLFGFFSRPRGRLVADPARAFAIRATDLDAAWTVHIEPQGRRVVPAAEPADLTIAGPAAHLYHLLWNRRDTTGLAVEGDERVLELWRAQARVRWS